MRKIFITIAVFIYVAGLSIAGYCQDDNADNAVDQYASQEDQGLDSEISSEETESADDADRANMAFNAGERIPL